MIETARKCASVVFLACFFAVLLGAAGCDKEPKLTLLYSYDFNDGKLGPEWKNEGGDWKIVDGKLVSRRAKNKDLVLMKAHPADVAVTLDMLSHDDKIDIKFRTHGNPQGGDLHDAGAYSYILGGWKGKISTITRIDEHEPNRVEDRATKHKKDHWYKMKIVKKGGKIQWFVDGKLYLTYEDKQPLAPPTYAHFSFSNWATRCEFDNLKIYRVE